MEVVSVWISSRCKFDLLGVNGNWNRMYLSTHVGMSA